MFNQLKEARLKTIEKKELTEKNFSFVCDPSANNFVKTINEAIRIYFEKFQHYHKYIDLVNSENNYLANVKNVYSDIHSEFLSIPLLSIYEKFKNENTFSLGNCKGDCEVLGYDEDIPIFGSSVGASYYISQFTTILGEKVLKIGLDTFILTGPSCCSVLYFDCYLYIEIREILNFDHNTDFYKYLTDCDKIENMKLALGQVKENIYIKENSETPDNITKFRESNKLKTRKTKKCISVIRKRYKIKTKSFIKQESLSPPYRYRKNQIKVVITFGLDFFPGPGKYPETQGESYLTLAELETKLIKESSNKYTYYISAKSEAQSTNEVVASPDATVWCPYVLAIPKHYNKIYSNEFNYKYNIYMTDEKSKINRQPSKRSKIICLRNV
jgi:hypothetical protein